MGQDNPAVKPLLIAFGEGAVFKKMPEDVVIPVWLYDHTSHSKFWPKSYDVRTKSRTPITTGYAYLMECFLRKPVGSFNKGAIIVYVLLDRGSPVNKSIEHAIRYANVVSKETPPNYFNSPALVNDFRMPDVKSDDDWKSFVSNPQLYRRMIHYMTMRMIGTRGDIDEELQKYVCELTNEDYDDALEDLTIDYKNDKTLFLHGGRLRKPDPDRPRFFKYADPFLLEFKTITKEVVSTSTPSYGNVKGGSTSFSSSSSYQKPVANCRYDTKRSVKINRAYDSTVINNLLEGEMAALFYAQAHIERGDSVMIVTPDIDVLMMLLLSCPDRIDPVTGKFVCKVFVQLVVSRKDYTRFVDVHQLWFNMHSSRPLKPVSGLPLPVRYRNKSSNEFVSKMCAMCLLCGTDYVKNYCLGITNKKGGIDATLLEAMFGAKPTTKSEIAANKTSLAIRKNLEELKLTPWIVHTFLKYYDEFEDVITITRSGEYDAITKLRTCAKVDVNERLFIAFTRRIYVEHYTASSVHEEKFEKEYGADRSLENVKKYLYEDKVEQLREKLAAQKRQQERLKKPNAKVPKTLMNVDETKSMTTIKRNRLPPPRKIRVSCRHLLWQIEYMMNGYKFNCSVIDPTTLYLELPYYGWYLDSGKCKVASRVSLKRPNVEISKKGRAANRRFVALQVAAAEASSLMELSETVDRRSNNDVMEVEGRTKERKLRR